MNNIAQTVAQSLNNTFNLCIGYLVVSVGLVLLMIGIFKFAAWIVDRRHSFIEPCLKCGGVAIKATPTTSVCRECGAREFLAGVFDV